MTLRRTRFPDPPPKRPTGRPTKFDDRIPSMVKRLALLGATVEDIAAALEVTPFTVREWIKVNRSGFSAALKEGREMADANVGTRLYERAFGYSHEDVKIFLNKDDEPIYVPYTKHYPPDPVSMIFWLTNRRPDLWRRNRDRDDHGNSNNGGGDNSATNGSVRRIESVIVDAEYTDLGTDPGGDAPADDAPRVPPAVEEG